MGLEYNEEFDGEVASVCHTETMKAKMNHRCTECKGIVEAGQYYERTAALFDGRWSTYRKCEKCMAFESAMDAHYRGFKHGTAFGDMYGEEIRRTLNDLYSGDRPGRWFSVARKLVAVRRNYEDQIKRCVEDKSGRGNARRPSMFGWTRTKHRNIMLKLKSELEPTVQ